VSRAFKIEEIEDERLRRKIQAAVEREDTDHRAARKTRDAEHRVTDGSRKKSATVVPPETSELCPYFKGSVEIRIHHVRRKLADSDGYFIKHVIDGLVDLGILADDSPEQIPQRPVETQEKVGTDEQEKTIITITERKNDTTSRQEESNA
jgi:hypothetical protein